MKHKNEQKIAITRLINNLDKITRSALLDDINTQRLQKEAANDFSWIVVCIVVCQNTIRQFVQDAMLVYTKNLLQIHKVYAIYAAKLIYNLVNNHNKAYMNLW